MTDESLRTYLWLVGGRGSGDGYIELRARTRHGMRSEFFAPRDAERVEARVGELAERTDVYVGAALRRERRGSADAVSAAWLAWVDCDSAASTARLASLPVPPSFTVASGSAGHVHAYWMLTRPLDATRVRSVNLRLAGAVAGDVRCADPARILRPPGTLNHKTIPPRPVELLREPSALAHDPVQLAASVPAPRPSTRASSLRPAVTSRRPEHDDPLHAISAREYVPALSGRSVGGDGKAKCPFHDDHTPSLHAYADPDRGWYCYGCGKGGSIYDFAAELWQMPTNGPDFLRLRDRIRDEFGVYRARPPLRSSGLSL